MRDSFFVRLFAAEVPDAAGHRSCCTGPFARIPPDYPPFLADRLAHVTALQVKDAADGESIVPGRVYLATPNRHLMVENGRVRLSDGPRENRSRPSIDVLFRSVAVSFGPRAIGVVLSGALDDGTAGLWAIKDRGGSAVVQKPDDAEMPSMPLNAATQVEVTHIRPAAGLAALLADIVTEPAVVPPGANPRMQAENRIALHGDSTSPSKRHGTATTSLEQQSSGRLRHSTTQRRTASKPWRPSTQSTPRSTRGLTDRLQRRRLLDAGATTTSRSR